MMKKKDLDKFHRHEALDRAHVVRDIIYNHLLDHPYIDLNKKLRKKVEKAADLIGIVYQEIGT